MAANKKQEKTEDELLLEINGGEIKNPAKKAKIKNIDKDEPVDEDSHVVESHIPEEDGGEVTPEQDEQEKTQKKAVIEKETKTVEIFGHEIVLSTITCRDLIFSGVYAKDARETSFGALKQVVGELASAIETIDGLALGIDIQNDYEKTLQFKAGKLLSYHPSFISEIYKEYLIMNGESVQNFN